MSGNYITGLPNPIDRDSAANKKLYDNGEAITKLSNGAFTAVSDIDFDGFSLKNIPDPIDGKDAVNKAYVDDKNSTGCSHQAYYNRVGGRKRTTR